MERKPFTYGFGEFVDKLCIVSKKALAGLPAAELEINEMVRWMNELGMNGNAILAIIRLAQTNMDIWALEHSVRNASEGSMPLSEVGRRAEMIRNTNKRRKEYQNELEIAAGGTSIEEKIKHLSEDSYEKYYRVLQVEYKGKTREEGGKGE